MKPGRIAVLAVAAIVLIAAVAMGGSMFETVDAGEVVVMQDPIDGELHFWTQPGTYFQNFGRITRYRKSAQYYFSAHEGPETSDDAIKVRFNDGGHADISGSLRFELPVDENHLRQIHTKFGSQEAVEKQIIRTVVSKSVYMSGPLMSSKESASERRSDLIQYISDQVEHGVFKTTTEEVKVQDTLSGKDKTVSRVQLVTDEKGVPLRQEGSPLEELGIKAYNFTINQVKYAEAVETQINDQQKLTMQVQTAIAEAKQAEQKAITVEKNGQAEAAEAKWKQEVIKATQVTEAEQKREVARLAMEAAEFTKKEQILLGEGEAARRKAVMTADGALDKKLDAWVEVNKAFAAELGKQRWVPEVVIGNGAAGSTNGASNAANALELLQVKAARDLMLDVRTHPGTSHPGASK